MLRTGALASRDVAIASRFQAGQTVRARNIQSQRAHASATLCARARRNDRPRSRRLRVSRHQRALSRAKSRSTFIPSDSLRANCGASKRRRATPSISICGMTTLSPPESDSPNASTALPRFHVTPMGRCLPSRGRRRRSRSRSSSRSRGISPGRSGPSALADELKAAADGASPTTARATTTIGWPHSNAAHAKGLTDALPGERKEAWADAYRHTPHGKPVELKGR